MRRVVRAPNVRGGIQNAIFDISRSPSPKPALVPASRLYFDIEICFMKFCCKSHWKLKEDKKDRQGAKCQRGV